MSIPFLLPMCLGTDGNIKLLAVSHLLIHTYLVKHENFIDLASEIPQDRIDVHRGILDGWAYDFGFVLVLKHQVHKYNGHRTELRQITPKLFVINLSSRDTSLCTCPWLWILPTSTQAILTEWEPVGKL